MIEFLLSPQGALSVAALATLLAWAESAKLPWAPFLILYALALPLPPLLLGTYRFGDFASVFQSQTPTLAGLSILILAWEIGIMGLAYEKSILPRFGKAGMASWSPMAAMDALLEATSRTRRVPLRAVQAWYGFFFLVWAPLAEELFFWGYLYPALREGNGPITASLIVSVFFGIRHGLHFLFLPGSFPWPAAAALMLSAGGAAILNGFLFEAAQSLWPLILLHLISNLITLGLLKPRERNTLAAWKKNQA